MDGLEERLRLAEAARLQAEAELAEARAALDRARQEYAQLEAETARRLAELAEQRDFPYQVLNLMGQGLTYADENGVFNYVNPAFAHMLGYEPDELIGRSPFDVTLPEYHGRLQDALRRRTTGAVTTYETRLRRADGSPLHVLITGAPRMRDGQFKGSVTVITNLDDRRQMEEALRRSEAEARTLSQVASRTSNMVIISDPDGNIEWVNDAFTQITEYTLAEAIGKRPSQILQGPDSDPEVVAFMRERVHRRQGFETELINYSKSGRPYWVSIEVKPVYDESGTLTNFIAIESDITQRKTFEQQLADSEARLRQVIDLALDASIIIDSDGVVTQWNQQAEVIFGWNADEVLGHPLVERIVPPDFRDGHRQGMARYHATGHGPILGRRIELEALHRDGRIFPIELAVTPVETQAGMFFSAFIRDISQRRATEDALRRAKESAETADRAKSEFLANMSHEIRTPMNAVIGLSGLLLDSPLSAEQRDHIETIRQSGDALLAILNEILDFSKIEAGMLELESAPLDVRRCVEDAVGLLGLQASARRLDLAFFVEEDVPRVILGDAARLRQILVNLVSNAIKFTTEGEVVVSVTTVPWQDNRYRLRFTVRDTGIGIAPERLSHLFQPFRQLDASTTRRFGGTGLGLAISQRLAQMMGSRIQVESEPGRGSSFYFDLEVTAVTDSAEPVHTTSQQLAGRHILIVDDNKTNRHILAHYARAWQMHPHMAASAAEALEIIERGQALDVAVLDVLMPDTDGISLARILHHHPAARHIPIIILSSTGRSEVNLEGVAVAAYLHKPLRPAQLFEMLSSVLSPSGTVAPAPQTPTSLFDSGMARRQPLRILLAEDNLVNQKVALKILERLGYQADVAANGRQALAALERQPYDVVLMDIQMPEMDGVTATQEIAARYGDRRPYIVAMTAHALEGDREFYLSAGMNDYLSKPVRPEALMEALDRAGETVGHDSAETPSAPPH